LRLLNQVENIVRGALAAGANSAFLITKRKLVLTHAVLAHPFVLLDSQLFIWFFVFVFCILFIYDLFL